MLKVKTVLMAAAVLTILATAVSAQASVERQTTYANGKTTSSQSNWQNNGNGTYTHNQQFDGANGGQHDRSVTRGNGQVVTSNTYANTNGASHTVTRTR